MERTRWYSANRGVLPEREGYVEDAVQSDDEVGEMPGLLGLDRAGEHLAEPHVRSVSVCQSICEQPDRKVLMHTAWYAKRTGVF